MPVSHGSADTALLDEDSDSQPSNNEAGATEENIVTPMAVEDSAPGQSDNTSDPLYHQCKTAWRTAFVEKLVSVSGDRTFGSCVSSQASTIGNLTDDAGVTPNLPWV